MKVTIIGTLPPLKGILHTASSYSDPYPNISMQRLLLEEIMYRLKRIEIEDEKSYSF